jgi:broad specificity phosphatase PhoE
VILWVRHGQSTWNVIDRMQGQAVHPPLTDLGREQAAQAAKNLDSFDVTEILSSPAVRARETADIIAAELGLAVQVEPLLVERGLEEEIGAVLGRVQQFLGVDRPGTVVAVSHGDTIGIAVGLLSGRPPQLPANGSIIAVDPHTRTVDVTSVAD